MHTRIFVAVLTVLSVFVTATIGGVVFVGVLASNAQRSQLICFNEDGVLQESTIHTVQEGVPASYQLWAEAIESTANRHGIPPALFAGLVHAESGFDHSVISHAGAIGLAQLMPGTANGLGVDPYDPLQNLDGGARYLADMLDQFGDIRLALAAYNAGPGRVRQYNGIPPIKETQAYVPRVLQFAQLYGDSLEGLDCEVIALGDPLSDAGSSARMSWGGHANGRIPRSELSSAGGGHLLHPDAAQNFLAMAAAYQSDTGWPLVITDSYRSYEGQLACTRQKGNLCAKPGTSNHGWGKAIDIHLTASGGQNRVLNWLYANGSRYGWHHPSWARANGSKPEPWHWEYWAERAGNDMPLSP
jgi:LAS superfamily LD-carboxypeptidase LdcB